MNNLTSYARYELVLGDLYFSTLFVYCIKQTINRLNNYKIRWVIKLDGGDNGWMGLGYNLGNNFLELFKIFNYI